MTSRRNVFLFSGYLLALASLLPLAPLGGCGGDDSGSASDSGTDSPVSPERDTGTGPGPDATSNPDTGGPTSDSGGNAQDGAVEAASDTGTPQGEDAGQNEAGGDSGVPNDPIALWHFDEGTGSSAFDSSGNHHTATLVAGATFAAGKHGTGLSPNASGWAVVPAPTASPGIDDAGESDASDAGSDGGASDDSGDDAEAPDADAASDAGVFDASDASDASEASDDAGDSSSPDASEPVDAGPPFAPLSFDTTKSFSIACWVKVYTQGPGQWQSAFSRSGQNLAVFTLKLRGDSPAPTGENFDFDFPGADDTSTGVYTVAQSTTSPAVSPSDGSASYWYHLAGVLNTDPAGGGATTVNLYVNGAVQSSVNPGAAPILAAVGDTIIGASLFGAVGASWNGVIDEVYLFDRALSSAEVAALYNATK